MPAKKKLYAWPSLEDQLRAAQVVKGSALDKLIRDHQGFQMLRAEEAHDQLGLPPWLRVYWRKLHPDANYSGPSGGYPLTLSDLHEWMLEHQDLRTPPADVVDPVDPRAPVAYTGSDKKKSGSKKKGGSHGH
jgi:hypothetical protein